MRYQISGKQIDIGESLQLHVQTELGEVVKKYAERPTDANVVFSRSAHEYVCETTVHLSTGLLRTRRQSVHVPCCQRDEPKALRSLGFVLGQRCDDYMKPLFHFCYSLNQGAHPG